CSCAQLLLNLITSYLLLLRYMASSGSRTSSGGSGSGSGGGGAGTPCGACKFLRRRCAADCIFAPYFCPEQGPARFAAIHKVFGASNVSKLLLHLPPADRCEAVVTIAYEAQARLRDPVYGCVAHVFALQHQVAYLQAQIMQMKAQLAQNSYVMDSPRNTNNNNATTTTSPYNSWQENNHNSTTTTGTVLPSVEWGATNYYYSLNPPPNTVSPQSSPDSVDCGTVAPEDYYYVMEQMKYRSEEAPAAAALLRKRPYNNELGDLQALALKMMMGNSF
ncbi:LOB domain-containing protein 16, partial [Linum grandiflorum]